MRVLLVSHRFPPDSVAGVERITQTLAAELATMGDQVSVVARSFPPSDGLPYPVRERLADGTWIHWMKGGQFRLDSCLLHHERLETMFEAALLKSDPEVVHVLQLLWLSPRFIAIAKKHGLPVVVSLQDFYFVCPMVHLRKTSDEFCSGPAGGHECARSCFAAEGAVARARWPIRASYFRRLLSMADRFICPSQYVAFYFRSAGFDASRVRVIPNGIAPEVIRAPQEERRAQPGSLHLACIGSVLPFKGAHVIIEAIRLARVAGTVTLSLLGEIHDHPYAERLRHSANAIEGLTLRFAGLYELSQLPEMLRTVDCVVAPSLVYETFSIAIHEALSRGIPIVVGRLGALPEAVVEGVNGFTFDVERPAELAAILQVLVEDPSLLARLRDGAIRSAAVASVISVPEHARAVRATYEEVLGRSAGVSKSDAEELEALHSALVHFGADPAG